MNKTLIFPSLQIAMCIGAAVFYALAADFKRMTYWLAAAVLTYSVTF